MQNWKYYGHSYCYLLSNKRFLSKKNCSEKYIKIYLWYKNISIQVIIFFQWKKIYSSVSILEKNIVLIILSIIYPPLIIFHFIFLDTTETTFEKNIIKIINTFISAPT